MTADLEDYIRSWIHKAEKDIRSAELLISDPIVQEMAAFHCQQAIEKMLKAFLIYKGFEIERTHNIVYLLEKCTIYDSVFSLVDPLNINESAVSGRYPDENYDPSEEEVSAYFFLAKEIETLVKERIIF